jgi:hypothetical protein
VVARLSAAEFQELIVELVQVEGLAKFQEKLLRSHALVSRRRLGTVDALSRQLCQLTLGLEREGLATQVVITLWEDLLRRKLTEDAAKQLEEIGEKINRCLVDGAEIDSSKEGDLRAGLSEYRAALAAHVGATAARLTMLTRAFPAVARLLRESAAGD